MVQRRRFHATLITALRTVRVSGANGRAAIKVVELANNSSTSPSLTGPRMVAKSAITQTVNETVVARATQTNALLIVSVSGFSGAIRARHPVVAASTLDTSVSRL